MRGVIGTDGLLLLFGFLGMSSAIKRLCIPLHNVRVTYQRIDTGRVIITSVLRE